MLITGVLLQTIVRFRASSISGPIIEGANNAGQSGEQMDHLLEQAHFQMLWMFAGMIVSWLLMAVGAAIVIWGVYRRLCTKKPADRTKSPSRTA
jgi:hypothetical protein